MKPRRGKLLVEPERLIPWIAVDRDSETWRSSIGIVLIAQTSYF
jgi:hypothetical protein